MLDRLLCSAFVISGTVLYLDAPARACGEPDCFDPVRLLGQEGSEIPGNLVFFEVLSNDPGTLTLRTRAGQPIAASTRMMGDDLVFAPVQTIPAGTEVELVFTVQCRSGTEPPREKVYPFRAGPEVNVIPQPAEIEIISQGIGYPERLAERHGFVELLYRSPNFSGDGAHLENHFATIDGDRITSRQTSPTSTLEVHIRSSCDPGDTEVERDSCGDIYGVPPGSHVVEFWTEVVGQNGPSERVRKLIETSCAQP